MKTWFVLAVKASAICVIATSEDGIDAKQSEDATGN
jgi:hypothetical protein